MNTESSIRHFIDNFRDVTTSPRPNWITVELVRIGGTSGGYFFQFDFKHDAARKAFGALCHTLYTSSERWRITTQR